jgi:hypothetical protein
MKKKTIKLIVITGSILIVLGGGFAASQYFMPHRDVQSVNAFVEIDATEFVDEYLANNSTANEKYLDPEGDSKVIIVKGKIKNIDTDQNNQRVIVLKSNNDELGVSCTFTTASNANSSTLKIGDNIKIKGVVRSGAEYDEDLELFEDAILEKCDIIE